MSERSTSILRKGEFRIGHKVVDLERAIQDPYNPQFYTGDILCFEADYLKVKFPHDEKPEYIPMVNAVREEKLKRDVLERVASEAPCLINEGTCKGTCLLHTPAKLLAYQRKIRGITHNPFINRVGLAFGSLGMVSQIYNCEIDRSDRTLSE